MSPVSSHKLKSNFTAAWAGQMPLRQSYWLLGVGGNMAFVGALVAVYGLFGRSSLPAMWMVYLASLTWFVFIFRVIHASANRYKGRPVWAFLARAGVWIGVVRMAAEAMLLAALAGSTAA